MHDSAEPHFFFNHPVFDNDSIIQAVSSLISGGVLDGGTRDVTVIISIASRRREVNDVDLH
jgi:hypothetical protein